MNMEDFQPMLTSTLNNLTEIESQDTSNYNKQTCELRIKNLEECIATCIETHSLVVNNKISLNLNVINGLESSLRNIICRLFSLREDLILQKQVAEF